MHFPPSIYLLQVEKGLSQKLINRRAMANVNGEIKPKKGGGGGMYVYKFDTGASRQKSLQEPEKKTGFHSGISWGLRRSKTVREVVHHNYHHQDNGSRVSNKNPRDYNDVEKEIVELARKSASSEAAHRKSVSHLEVNVASVAAFLQVKVLVTDMPGFMQVHAFRCARATYDSLEKFSSKHMAYNIKKEFDKVYGPAWHCIVGSSFGSFVTHATGCFLYFSMEKLNILVFKTKVQRSPQD